MITRPLKKTTALLMVIALLLSGLPFVSAAATEWMDSGAERDWLVLGFSELDESVLSRKVPPGTPIGGLALPDTLTATGSAITTAPPSDATEEAQEETITIPGVMWQSAPEYEPNTAGTYNFTAELPQGYTLAGGVDAPVITVEVTAATGLFVTFDFPLNDFDETWFYLTEGNPVTDADLLAGVSAVDENGDVVDVTVQSVGGLNMQNPQIPTPYYPATPYIITYAAEHPVTGEEFTKEREAYVTAASITPLGTGDQVTVNGLDYEILTMPILGVSNGTVSVGDNRTYSGDVIIPATITVSGDTSGNNGVYDVVAIGSDAFDTAGGVTGVDLSGASTLVSIGNYAFNNCQNLTTLNMSGAASLQTIDDNAFRNCTGLSGTLTLPAGLQTIGAGAFRGCTNLSGTLALPANLKTIGDGAFWNCTGIIALDFSGAASLQTIVVGAFMNTGITALDFSGADSLQTIGDQAFQNCARLLTADLSALSITALPASMFQGCTRLATVTLPPSLTSIGGGAFYNCAALNELVFLGLTAPTLGTYVFTFSAATPTTVTITYPVGGTGYDLLAFNAATYGYAYVTWDFNGATYASINPASATFDRYAGSAGYQDVSIMLTPGSFTLNGLRRGGAALTLGTDYTVNGNDYTINKNYLAALAVGQHKFVFEMSGGIHPALTVNVIQSTPGTLTGTATINNTSPKIGDTLAAIYTPGNNTGALRYAWAADGAAVGADSSAYTVTAADLGKRITVVIGSSIETGTLASAPTNAVVKSDYAGSVTAPVVASKTHSSVTLTAVAGYEYAFAAMGAPAPTGFVGNPAFAGLSPDTGYDFYQRAAETADTNASVPARLTVRTDAAPTTTVGVTGVSLDKTALTLTAGGSETLTATVAPANATNKAVSWSSSNAGVATVSNGTVTAVSAGTATITVTTVDGGKTASCAVTVNAAPVTSTSSSDSDSGGSSGGGSDYTAQQQGTYWIEPSEAKTLAGAARGRGDSYVRTRRATSVGIRKGALAELAGLRYEHDTIADGAVQVRISFSDPAKTVKDVLVSGYVKGADVAWVKAHFEKWFKNKLRVVHLEQQGDFGMTAQIAAKVDLEGMDTKNLYFYSYDKAANIYRRIEKPAYWIDKNGYLHFETELAGDIIISEGPLERK